MIAVDAAWLAGIVDGEGSVFCSHNVTPHGHYYYINLRIRMSHRETIYKIQELVGGAVLIENARARTRSHTATQWGVLYTGERAARILDEILPYMVTKKDQAEVAIHHCRFGDTKDPTAYHTLRQLKKASLVY